MNVFTKGLLKVAYLKKKFALEFLNYKNGDYIETISAYQEKFNSSRGSVQIALKELQIEKAIKLQSKGASGTQILKLDYNKLLEILEIHTIIGAMPFTYTVRQEGLAAALIHAFKDAPFRFACSYRKGSLNRIKGLINNYYDFIILSKLSADYYKNIYDFKEILVLDNESVYNKPVWIVKKGVKKISKGMRIGVDKSIFDHFFIINSLVNDLDPILVDIHYPNVISEILSDNIDASIWSTDMAKFLNSEKVDIIDNLDIEYSHSDVIITNKYRGDIVKVIKDYIKPSIIRNYQQKIIEGKIIPNF